MTVTQVKVERESVDSKDIAQESHRELEKARTETLDSIRAHSKAINQLTQCLNCIRDNRGQCVSPQP